MDFSGVCTTLNGYVNPNATASDSTVIGYSFILFNKSGTLQTCAGGDQTISSVELIASASKLPSSAAILTLVDAGKLDLDTPVATYLRGSAVTWPLAKSSITMRMLLNHTSGLVGINDTQPACLDEETGTTLAACAQDVANTTLQYVPGTHFNYGGADYQVAGYIATVLSGETWQQFFADTIGTPLGLSVYTYGDPTTVTNPRIAGGGSSDVSDYMQIIQMLQAGGVYNGKQVLSSSVISSDLETNQISGKTVAYSPLDSTMYPGYASGLFISAASLYTGSPGPEFSDPGLFGTTPWFDNGLGYGAVLLISSNTQTGVNMWNAVRPEIISQLTGQ
jgi:CubicO group peptidase (beta-lactamase class C family)